MEQNTNTYEVQRISKDQLQISGKGESALWKEAVVLSNFISPWDSETPSKIEFKALWDENQLFFYFTVFDTEIHIDKKDDTVVSIGNSDRVELFFRPDSSLNPYYCLEMDTDARIMDFIAYPNKEFNYDWKWPEGDIDVRSSKNETSFTVEGAISIDSLKKFNLIKDNKIETGIFRAKYNSTDNINFEPTWITWVNPNTETPNFHIASSFGVLDLK
ncbi:sugar-binding protein [Flavobacterium hiemivividum]|uniref:Endoxylanase n=1 Tax=Flavobacterium hiemivividum TaxID=2541734 RepID=A0A4R5CND1_9FLAO|nr:sugar-binding protein [Flavobacterium hiemivividum]TDE01922.1 endoxylanase [Flavobacterium hiemivividum]